jgi:hypothetical protein
MEEHFEVRDQRNQDWVWTTKSLLYHADCDEKMYKVYCGLAAHANNHTQESFPAIHTLVKELHMSRSTIIRSLAKLEAFEFIGVERKTGISNVYILLAIPDKSPPRGKGRSGAGKPEEPFVWEEYLTNMATDKMRSRKILAFYFQRKKMNFSSHEQVKLAIDEQIVFASKVAAFEKPKIVWAMDNLDRSFPAWTLKTVLRELTR